MTRMIKQYLVAVILLVPTCLLLAFALQHSTARAKAPAFVLPITAYDPRDPVFGHYLEFQIFWPMHHTEPVQCDEAVADCRACLRYSSKDTLQSPVVTIVPQKTITRHHCTATLNNLTYYKNAFTEPTTQTAIPSLMAVANQPHRFYVSEKDAPALEQLFNKDPKSFGLQVKVVNETLYVENLLIHGKDYRQALQTKARP
jgi:hypothetical protein